MDGKPQTASDQTASDQTAADPPAVDQSATQAVTGGAEPTVPRSGWRGVLGVILKKRGALVLVAIALVFVSSSIPFEKPLGVQQYDKIFHLIEYMVLGFLLFNLITQGFKEFTPVLLVLGFLILITIGVLDELYQFFIPGRTPDRNDLLFSSMGSSLALLSTIILGWVRSGFSRRSE